jgi:hypothetical protein
MVSSSSSVGPFSINAPVCTAAVGLLCNRYGLFEGCPFWHRVISFIVFRFVRALMNIALSDVHNLLNQGAIFII